MATLEFFGTTTFRLKANGLTIFLDTWLDRTAAHPKFLSIDEVTECDYICISHAHFDHLPGADRIALKTGARVIANPESIRLLRDAGVPETQLITVAGGERVPLFTKSTWQDLAAGKCATSGPNLPGAPPRPDPSLAVMAVDVWPSLHCLMSIGAHPDEFDLGNEEPTPKNEWKSTLDISYGMKWGLSRLDEILPPQAMQNPGVKALVDYFHDEGNKYSHCDGGQLMYNLRWGGEALDERVVLWNGHMGAYEGIMKTVHPQPQIAILGAAGEVNLNGRPYKGTAAEFLRSEVEWLGHPERVMWCLHDESPTSPYRSKTGAADQLIESSGRTKIVTLENAVPYELFP